MKRSYIIIVAVLLQVSAFAQFSNNDNDRNRNRQRNGRAPSLSAGIVVSDPQGEFGFLYGGHPAGLAGQFLINSGRSPIEFGVGASWQGMGSQKKDISIYQGEDIEGDEVWSQGNMQVSSNIYAYNGLLRLRPFTGNIQIYGDLIAGMKTFSTKTVIEEDNGGYTEVIEEHRDHRDFALTYGWAAGLKIRLSQYVMIEGRFENMRGGKTTFVDPESIFINGEGQLSFSELESNSSVLNYQLGLSFEF